MTAYWEVSLKKKSIGKICIALVILVFLYIGIKNRITSSEVIEDIKEENETQNNQSKNDSRSGESETDNKKKPETTYIYVHITGAVKKEGLFKLHSDSRLNDLIDLCGGLEDDADIKKINLAMKLDDQMRLHISRIGEETIVDSKSDDRHLNHQKEKEKININNSSLEELDSLPGIGKKRAQDIIDLRNKKKIKSADDLREIHGVGDKLIEKIEELIEY